MRVSSTPFPAPEAAEIDQLDAEFCGLGRGADHHCPDIRQSGKAGQRCPDIRQSGQAGQRCPDIRQSSGPSAVNPGEVVVYAHNNREIEQAFLEGRYLGQELVDKGFAKVV